MTVTESVLGLQTIDPGHDAGWERLMTGGRGSLFGSPPWIRCLVATYGFDIRATVLTHPDGTPAAGLAYADVDDVRGRRIVSLPFCDRVDPVVDDIEQWQRLVEPLVSRRVPITMRCLNAAEPGSDARFVEVRRAAWHATDLTRRPEEIESSFAAGARRNIRAACRHGVTIRFGTSVEDVRTFHRLHCHLRKHKYRLLAQPLAFFEHIWEQFSPTGSIAIGLAEHQGQVIAAALYLVWDDVFYYRFGASVPASLAVRPNDVLAWESIHYARALGCRTYDWGLSDLDQPGLIEYKRKFATSEGQITLLRHEPGASDRRDAETMKLIDQFVELLTHPDVPDDVTRRAGELTYSVFC